MSVLRWDKPQKVLTTKEWQGITADGAPPGVYTPNMSREDVLTWRAKLIGGKDPRVEIRTTVIQERRPTERYSHYAQILLVVRKDSVRFSANGTACFEGRRWEEFLSAISEAKEALDG